MYFIVYHNDEVGPMFEEKIEKPIFAKYLIEVKEPVEMYERMKNLAYDEESKSIKYEIASE